MPTFYVGNNVNNFMFHAIQHMYDYKNLSYWENRNMTPYINEHNTRLQRIKNCSGNDLIIAEPFLSILTKDEGKKFPWMREMACRAFVKK